MRDRFVPSRAVRSFQRRDSNCRPQSVTMLEGTPNRAIPPLMNVCATASAVMLESGMASGQRV